MLQTFSKNSCGVQRIRQQHLSANIVGYVVRVILSTRTWEPCIHALTRHHVHVVRRRLGAACARRASVWDVGVIVARGCSPTPPSSRLELPFCLHVRYLKDLEPNGNILTLITESIVNGVLTEIREMNAPETCT